MHPVFHSSQTCPRCCEHCSTGVREISQYFSAHQISTELMQFKQPNQILIVAISNLIAETSWLTVKPCLQSRGYKSGAWRFLYLSIFSHYRWKIRETQMDQVFYTRGIFPPKHWSILLKCIWNQSINVLQSNSFSFSAGRKKSFSFSCSTKKCRYSYSTSYYTLLYFLSNRSVEEICNSHNSNMVTMQTEPLTQHLQSRYIAITLFMFIHKKLFLVVSGKSTYWRLRRQVFPMWLYLLNETEKPWQQRQLVKKRMEKKVWYN